MPARRTHTAALLLLALLPACAPSHWESHFVLTDEAPPSHTSASRNVLIRNVPWERLSPVLDDLRRRVAASDAPVNDWPAERRRAAEQQLLTALQVTPQSGVDHIIGFSEFRTTDYSTPDPAELRKLASSLNASLVVWTSRSLGTTDRIDYIPITTWTTGSTYPRRDRHGRVRSETYNESSTTWTPVVSEAEQTAFLAYFLR